MFYQSEVSSFELVEDLVSDVWMLSERRLEVPHLTFDRFRKLENSSGQQRPILPQNDLKESASDSEKR
jgi:hypothetical protein